MPLTSGAAAHYLSMVPLTNTALLMCYADGTNGFKATCRTLTTATDGGDALTAGEASLQSDGAAEYISLSVHCAASHPGPSPSPHPHSLALSPSPSHPRPHPHPHPSPNTPTLAPTLTPTLTPTLPIPR